MPGTGIAYWFSAQCWHTVRGMPCIAVAPLSSFQTHQRVPRNGGAKLRNGRRGSHQGQPYGSPRPLRLLQPRP
eukprot:88628-Rhodomonas_salina.1